jgi:hypothetical protein
MRRAIASEAVTAESAAPIASTRAFWLRASNFCTWPLYHRERLLASLWAVKDLFVGYKDV